MSINLIENYSFEDGLAGWNTSGDVTTTALLGGLREGHRWRALADSWRSEMPSSARLIRVPEGATHFHVVYAIRPVLLNLGSLEVQVEFRGSANLDPPLPLRRRDVIDVINDGSLIDLVWETRYAVTGEIPPETEWARLRFVHPAPILTGGFYIDAVFMTTD